MKISEVLKESSWLGFGSYKIGENVEGKDGTKYEITDIVLNFSSLRPDVSVFYKYETVDGRKGHEKNNFITFATMLRKA